MSAPLPWFEIDQTIREQAQTLAALEPRVTTAVIDTRALTQDIRAVRVPNERVARARARALAQRPALVGRGRALAAQRVGLDLAAQFVRMARAIRRWFRRWGF